MKILIVDDDGIKSKFLKDYIKSLAGIDDKDFGTPSNYESAKLHIDIGYDIALIDYNLNDKKTGYDLLLDYLDKSPETLCLLYSADSQYVNKTLPLKIKCLSIEELQIELIQCFATFEQPPIPESFKMPQVTSSMTLPMYNKELCETLHKENEKDHEVIRKSVSDVKDSMKEVSREIRDAIKETREDNRKIFFVTIGVFATLVANLALSLLKG